MTLRSCMAGERVKAVNKAATRAGAHAMRQQTNAVRAPMLRQRAVREQHMHLDGAENHRSAQSMLQKRAMHAMFQAFIRIPGSVAELSSVSALSQSRDENNMNDTIH